MNAEICNLVFLAERSLRLGAAEAGSELHGRGGGEESAQEQRVCHEAEASRDGEQIDVGEL